MKYRASRLPAEPGAEGWITDLDGTRLMRVETVAHGRAVAVTLSSEGGEPLAEARLQRTLTGTVAVIEVGGQTFATLGLRGTKRDGALRVRAASGAYDIAGNFEAWDFHILLDTSPVADVAPRKTDATTYLIDTSDHEEQVPLLAMILATDLLVQATT
jgi:hypothetical protein